MRVLLLTASFGTGHTRAARSVERALLERLPEAETLVVDPLESARPRFTRVMSEAYLQLLKRTPWAFRYLYTGAEHPRLAKVGRNEVGRLLFLAMSREVAALARRLRPDAIVCTHPFPLSVAAALRAKGQVTGVLGAILTDFTAHPFWVTPGTDFYALAAEGLRPELLAAGALPEQLAVTGIPIEPGFGLPVDRGRVLGRLGLEEGPLTVAVMGGGLGLGSMLEAVDALQTVGPGIQILAIAGRNRRLRRQLRQRLSGTNVPMVALGYTRRVSELMAASDLLVSKPGGLSSAEALAAGLPVCAMSPLPGQEERNLDFLIKAGAMLAVNGPEGLVMAVRQMLDEPEQLSRMRQAAMSLARPDAAGAVADLIIHRVAGYHD